MNKPAKRITLHMGKTLKRCIHYCLFCIPLLCLAWPATAGEKGIMGWVEYVVIEPVDFRVKAKLDTGAKTSSIHAEDIETFKRNGDTWVRFTFEEYDFNDEDHDEDDEEMRRVTFERKRVRRVIIKRHNAKNQERHVVEMELCINGRRHTEQFSLIDRSRFLYPVLLGRRALKDIALVDASETFLTSAACQDEDKKDKADKDD